MKLAIKTFKIITAISLLLCSNPGALFAQKSDAFFVGDIWSNWHYYGLLISDPRGWEVSNGWVYVFAKEPYDFYYRFKPTELGLKKLSYKEWSTLKKEGGWITGYCTFEYFITDEHPTMKSCLKKYGYPCAKQKLDSYKQRPSVRKSEFVETRVRYSSASKISCVNFFFDDGSAYAISVDWKISKDGFITVNVY